MMKYIYEFIGTFFLVLTVGMTVANPSSIGLWAPLAIGSILAVMIYAGGHISGGHYNPAVSLAVFLRKRLALKDLWAYWAAQLLAGALASVVTIYFKGGVNHAFQPPLDMTKIFLAEFLFTFALCYVVLHVATSKATAGNSFFGWAIGFTVLAGAYTMGALSSAAFNPAVALGVTILNLSPWSHLLVYFAANLLGGAVAAWLFNAAHPEVANENRPV
jgi:aquaporin Z